MTESLITYNAKGDAVSFVGPDAVRYYQAAVLSVTLRSMERGLRFRAITPTRALKLATSYTGKTYKRGEYLKASADVKAWADTMKAALPSETRE